MPAELSRSLDAALTARSGLLSRLDAEDTNAYRLFHGTVEGSEGLTIDRYGDVLLVQSFHRPLPTAALAEVEAFYRKVYPGIVVIHNDRSMNGSRISNLLAGEATKRAELPRQFKELGINYRFRARHAGSDPWLFLDLRAARRRVMKEAKGRSVLNVFAYTCGVGIAAAVAGASQVVNVDFSDTCLAVGKENAGLNKIPISVRFIRSDAFAALRQYAGVGQPEVVRRKRLPEFPKLVAQQFDLVFVDPPRYSKSPFGVVDVVRDYPALFKLALLSTAEGGRMVCCNNVADVDLAVWIDQMERSARKAGRPIREIETIAPEADFPSPDDRPPLKMVMLRV
jgi:23S rRNA (cytosine1962-C5)-methyltransferase